MRRDETRRDEMGRTIVKGKKKVGRKGRERENGAIEIKENGYSFRIVGRKALVERCRRDKRIDRSRMIVENDRARAISNVFNDNEPFYGHDPRPPTPLSSFLLGFASLALL